MSFRYAFGNLTKSDLGSAAILVSYLTGV